jgi:hypothetical protein
MLIELFAFELLIFQGTDTINDSGTMNEEELCLTKEEIEEYQCREQVNGYTTESCCCC